MPFQIFLAIVYIVCKIVCHSGTSTRCHIKPIVARIRLSLAFRFWGGCSVRPQYLGKVGVTHFDEPRDEIIKPQRVKRLVLFDNTKFHHRDGFW